MSRLNHLSFMCVAVALLFGSCNKEKIEQLPDEIVYTDFEPDIQIRPIDSIIQIPYNPCSCIPSPPSGIDYFELDIDGDGNNDFKIVYRHWYQQWSNSSPCVNYMRELTIERLNANGGIVVKAPNAPDKTKAFKEGDFIDHDELFMDRADIYKETAQGGYVDFGNDGFIGVKLSDGSLGWIQVKHQICPHRLIVKDCAINKTSTNGILAGQKF